MAWYHKISRLFQRTKLNTRVFNIALPVFFAMISNTVIMVSDTIMVGKLGAIAIASAGLGGVIYYTILSILLGGSYAVQILTARRFGEKNTTGVGNVFYNSFLFSFFAGGILSMVGFQYSDLIVRFLSSEPEVISLTSRFLAGRFTGTFIFFMIFSLRGFFDGLGITQAGMISSFLVTFSNIFFNWIFIYGNLGFPAMGVPGAGFASALAGIPGLLVFPFFIWKKNIFRFSSGFHLSWKVIKEISVLGFAPSLEGLVTNSAFVIFTKLSGMIGTVSLAATNVMISILSISFMPGFSFGIAATTILGQAMGAGKKRLAYHGTFRAALWSAITMGFLGLVFIVSGKKLVTIITNDPGIINEVYPALVLMAFVQVGDAYHMVIGSALRGAGFVYWVLWMYFLASFVIMVPLAWLFGIYFSLGTAGLWASVAFWILALGITFVIRFRKKEWMNTVL